MRKISLGSGRLSLGGIAKSRQRKISFAAALALAPLSGLISSSARGAAADSVSTFTTGTALDVAGDWTPNGIPNSTTDALIPAAYAGPFSLTLSNAEAFGSLDDINTNAITITSSTGSTLTLGGTGTNSIASAPADELYVAAGGSLTFSTSAGALGVALGNTSGNFDVVGAGTINSVISASSTQGFAKTGIGSLTLSASNTFTGATAVNAGTLILSGSVNSTALSLGGGILSYTAPSGTQNFTTTQITPGHSGVIVAAGATATLGSISRSLGGTVDIGTTGTVTTTTANTATSILGGWATVGGTDWAVSAGNGTTAGAITALPSGSYTSVTGSTNPPSGWTSTQNISIDGVPTSAVLTPGTAAAPNLTTINSLRFKGTNAVNISGGTAPLTVGITNASQTVTTASTTGLFVGEQISGTGIPAGSQIATIPGGGTTFTIDFAATATTASLSAAVVPGQLLISSGGILVNASVGANNSQITAGQLQGASGADLVITNNDTSGSLSISAPIANNGSATALTLSGAGTVDLKANNTFTGKVYIDGATVTMDSGPASDVGVFGSISALTANQITVNGGAIENYSGSNTITANYGITVLGGGLTFNESQNKGFTDSSVITGVGGVTVNIGGTAGFTLSGANTFTGGFTFGGTAAGPGTLSGANNFGAGSIAVNLGTLTLSNANIYTGATTVANTAALAISNSGALGSTATGFSSGVTVASGGVLQLSNNISTTEQVPLKISGVGIAATGNGALESVSGTNTYTGPITLGANTTIGVDAGAATLNSATAIAGGFGLTLTGAGNGTISTSLNTGISSVTTSLPTVYKGTTDGIWALSGANTYTGATTVGGATTLEFTKEVSLYNQSTSGMLTATTSNLIVQAGGTAAFEVGNTGGFTTADIVALNALGTSTGGFENGSNLGIDTTAANLTYTGNSGVFTNVGSNVTGLAKLGINNLILTAAQTYTGPTAIVGGTLQLGTGASGANGSLVSPSILDNATLLIEPYAGTTITTNANIGGAGAVTVTGNGTGIAALGGTNTFIGATSVTAGVLDLTNSLALQNSTVSFTGAGAITFDSSVTSNAFSFGALGTNSNITLQNTSNVGITLTLGSYALQLGSGTPLTTTYTGNFLNTTGTGTSAVTFQGAFNTVALTGASTYTGPTTIFGSTVNLGNSTATGSVSSSSPLVMDGGMLTYTPTGSQTQSFASTTINAGASFINAVATDTLNLGALSRSAGGEVDFTSSANTGAVNTTTTANVNGILGGWATFDGKTTWAVAPAVAGGAITGLSNASYTETGTAGTTASNYLNQNIDVNASETQTAPIAPNSIRFNSGTAPYTLGLTGLNTITSGGILVTPNVGSASSPNVISGGSLTAGAGADLAISSGDIYFNGTGGSTALTISSTIIDNGSPMAVSYAGSNGRIALNLTNTSNSFSGGLFVNEGQVTAAAGSGTSLGVGTVTLSPNSSTSNAGALEFSTAGTTATGLLVDAIGVNQGQANGSIDNGGAGNYTLSLFGAPSATATFNGIINSYAATRCLNLAINSGTEIVGNTNNGSDQVIANGGTIQVGNGYLGSFLQSANSMTMILGGGTYLQYGAFAGFTSQAFNSGLTLNAGASTLSINNNSAAGTVVAFNSGITRNVGSTVNFVLPTGSQNAINGITTTQLNTNGILGGYATVGGTDWATNATNLSGGNIIALPAASYTNDTFSAGTNTNVTMSDAFAAGSTNSIRFNTAGTDVVTQTGTGIVTSGGILVTPNVGANAVSITGTSTTIEGSAGGDLIVIQNDATAGGGLTIGSVIANNTTATGLTKSGAGLLTLTGANTYTGGLYLNGGIVNAATTNIDGSSATNGIFFNGGELQASGAISTSKAVNVGVNGGTIDLNGNAVTLSGAVTGVANEAIGAGLLGGFNPTGVGLLSVVNSGAAATLQLTVAGSGTFSGGLSINGNSTVQTTAANALGTGYVTFGATGSPTVDMHGNAATVAGVIGTNTNAAINNTAAASTLTFDGVSSQSYSGTINNAISLAIALNNPTEAVTFSGANTYTGTTAVSAGKLYVNGGHTGGGAYTIGGGTLPALLGGYGSTASGVNVGAYGTIATGAPGTVANQVGNLSTGAVTYTSGTSTQFAATIDSNLSVSMGVSSNNAAAAEGVLAATGAINFDSSGTGVLLSVTDLGSRSSAPALGTVFTIATSTGTGAAQVTGSFANLGTINTLTNGSFTNAINASNGYTYSVTFNDPNGLNGGDNVTLTLDAVPEPGSASLLGIAAMGFLGRRRRKNAKLARVTKA